MKSFEVDVLDVGKMGKREQVFFIQFGDELVFEVIMRTHQFTA